MSTLATTLVRDRRAVHEAALVGSGATLIAVCAQISVPWEPVPFSLQTMAVSITAMALGARRGTLSVATYLAAGAAGLPVFATLRGGPQVLLGPTGGYLLAFLVGAWVMGSLAERGWDRKVITSALTLVAGHALMLGLGTLWLAAGIGLSAAWTVGAFPFLAGEGFKIAVAMGTLPGAWSLTRRFLS
jgi:biotin transport system substrate-specific component